MAQHNLITHEQYLRVRDDTDECVVDADGHPVDIYPTDDVVLARRSKYPTLQQVEATRERLWQAVRTKQQSKEAFAHDDQKVRCDPFIDGFGSAATNDIAAEFCRALVYLETHAEDYLTPQTHWSLPASVECEYVTYAGLADAHTEEQQHGDQETRSVS